mgnify:CR=1 FL=1
MGHGMAWIHGWLMAHRMDPGMAHGMAHGSWDGMDPGMGHGSSDGMDPRIDQVYSSTLFGLTLCSMPLFNLFLLYVPSTLSANHFTCLFARRLSCCFFAHIRSLPTCRPHVSSTHDLVIVWKLFPQVGRKHAVV